MSRLWRVVASHLAVALVVAWICLSWPSSGDSPASVQSQVVAQSPSIVGAGRERSQAVKDQGGPRSDRLSVDKDVLFRILNAKSSVYAYQVFDRDTVDVLGLSKVQVSEAKEAIAEAVEMLRILETANHSVESDDEGNEWIVIKAFPQAGLRGAFEAKLKAALGSDIGKLAMRRLKDTRTFSEFGELERKLFVEERPHGFTKTQYAITEEIYRDGILVSGFSSTVREDDKLWDRYGHLLKIQSE